MIIMRARGRIISDIHYCIEFVMLLNSKLYHSHAVPEEKFQVISCKKSLPPDVLGDKKWE